MICLGSHRASLRTRMVRVRVRGKIGISIEPRVLGECATCKGWYQVTPSGSVRSHGSVKQAVS